MTAEFAGSLGRGYAALAMMESHSLATAAWQLAQSLKVKSWSVVSSPIVLPTRSASGSRTTRLPRFVKDVNGVPIKNTAPLGGIAKRLEGQVYDNPLLTKKPLLPRPLSSTTKKPSEATDEILSDNGIRQQGIRGPDDDLVQEEVIRMMINHVLDRAAEAIMTADAVSSRCGGNGMGVDSGLPDFRGTEGFWRAYPLYQRLGLRFRRDWPTLAGLPRMRHWPGVSMGTGWVSTGKPLPTRDSRSLTAG